MHRKKMMYERVNIYCAGLNSTACPPGHAVEFRNSFLVLVGLNKLNCILGVNPLYYSYGIADYFLRLLANFELYFNKESNILETIIVIFD